jgi:hypothetical protein
MSENIIENKLNEKEQYSINFVEKFDDLLIEEIHKFRAECFPENMQMEPEDLKETLQIENGIHILMRDPSGKLVGGLFALNLADEYEELKEYDKDLQYEDSSLYVESASILSENRNAGLYRKSHDMLFQKAYEKGFKKVCMHARISNNVSDRLQSMYGAEFKRKIKNWFDFGEDFDYLEINLDPEKNKKLYFLKK